MKEFIRCLIRSNQKTLGKIGQKTQIEFAYNILEGQNENFADVSLKITNFKKIQQDNKFLFDFVKRKENNLNLFDGDIEILQDCVFGQKQHSFYFISLNDQGKKFAKIFINHQGMINIYTPYVNEDYSSAYRLSFEVIISLKFMNNQRIS